MTTPRPEAVTLRPGAERVWEELRAELALRDGFWLTFLFGAQLHEVDEYVARSRDVTRSTSREAEEIDITGGVQETLKVLLTRRRGVASTWLVDDPARPLDERLALWTGVLERLNERRDVIRRGRPSGLILCCPPGSIPMVRDTAPDLWSFRVHTADLTFPPQATRRASDGSTTGFDQGYGGYPVGDYEYQDSGSGLRDTGIPAASEPTLPLQRPAQPVRLDAEQVQELFAKAQDLDLRGEAEKAAGYWAEAAAVLRVILDRGDVAEIDPLLDLAFAEGRLGSYQIHRGRLADSIGYYEAALAAAQRARTLAGDTPRVLEAVGTAFGDLSEASFNIREIDAALTSAAAGVDVANKAHEIAPDAPESLRTRAATLIRLARVRAEGGDLDEAEDAASIAVAAARRYRDISRNSASAAHILARALDALGSALHRMGRSARAFAAYTESLRLSRRLATSAGAEQDAGALARVARTLSDIGDIEQERGRPAQAEKAYTEALQIARRARGLRGTTHDAMAWIASPLQRIAEMQRERGDLEGALASHTEVLELTREARSITGDTPDEMHNMSVALTDIAAVRRLLGDRVGARSALREALTLARRAREVFGDTPDILRDLSVVLGELGKLQQADEEPDAARDSMTEAVQLDRMILDAFGDSPDGLADFCLSAGELADLLQRQGDLTGARTLYTEVRTANDRLRDQFGPPFWSQEERAGLDARIAGLGP